MHHDIEYLSMMNGVRMFGKDRIDRTGTGTTSVFSRNMDFNISEDFPLLLSKKIHWPSVVHELLWFISGDTNVKYLQENGVRIWNEWATEEGELGPVYGAQWRDFNGVDQIEELIFGLKNDPFSRRHVVSAWNPEVLPSGSFSPKKNAQMGKQALPPCHTLFQFYVEELTVAERERIHKAQNGCVLAGIKSEDFRHQVLDKIGIPRLGLSCQLYQRSADVFLGVPFNVASYSLLTYLVAKTVDMHPMSFHWVGGDCHLYSNHKDQVTEQLQRVEDGKVPRHYPKVVIKTKRDRLEDYTFEDIELVDYFPMPAIKAPIAI